MHVLTVLLSIAAFLFAVTMILFATFAKGIRGKSSMTYKVLRFFVISAGVVVVALAISLLVNLLR